MSGAVSQTVADGAAELPLSGNSGSGAENPAAALSAEPDSREHAIIEKIDGLVGRNVRFRVDTDTERTVLQITDPETGEVVNSFPSEEMLEVMKRLDAARCHLVDCAG